MTARMTWGKLVARSLPMAMRRDQDHEQLRIHAFVCGSGCVERQSYEGSVNVLKLVELCPDHCRYAVVEWFNNIYVLDIKGDKDSYIVTEAKQYADVDAAIMATQLTY